MQILKRFWCLLPLILFTGVVIAQQKKKTGGFYNIDEVGIQFSDKKGLVLRAIGGYRFNSHLQAGVGVGLDDYTLRSVPVFGDVRYDLNGTKNTFFAYGGAGISFPWITSNQFPGYYGKHPDKTVPGFYGHAGIGYKIRTGKNDFHIAVGYSRAAMKLKYESVAIWPQPVLLGYTSYEYKFNRISIVAGITL